MRRDYSCPFQNRKIKHLENFENDILKTRFKQQQYQLWHQICWIMSTITNERLGLKTYKYLCLSHFLHMVSPTNWKEEKKGKTKKFQKGCMWKEVMMGSRRNCRNWSLENEINISFILFTSLSFTISFFPIFQFVFFLFLYAIVSHLSHFIPIWKKLRNFPRAGTRKGDLLVNLEGKR